MNQNNNSTIAMAVADLSELSGRAAFMALAKANESTQVAVLVQMREMMQLAKVKGSTIRLQIAKAASDRKFLRWTIQYKYVSWDVVQTLLDDLPMDVQKHYKSINRRIVELNAVNAICAGARADIRRLMYANGWAKPIKPII